MPIVKQCQICGSNFRVRPYQSTTAKFCSYACAGKWRSVHQRGSAHGGWKGGKDKRNCKGCGKPFEATPANPQRFCSRPCADKHGVRLRGPNNSKFDLNARRRSRSGKHAAWARSVISRDKATCQRCGITDVELQAHHIKPFKEFPELRWDVDNGLTVCAPCHWAIHAASNANGVNSGEIRPDTAEDNPEPSFGRKPVEGVTTNGRAYRRWNGECEWCGAFISRRWSDVVGRAHLFCSKRCAGKYKAANRTYRPWKNPDQPHGGNADTSAPPERDDIV
jgi:hypothetical protein